MSGHRPRILASLPASFVVSLVIHLLPHTAAAAITTAPQESAVTTAAARTDGTADNDNAETTTRRQAEGEGESSTFLDRMAAYGFAVRKAFDGSISENTPANFTLIAAEGEPSIYDINVAAKIAEWEPFKNSDGVYIIYPVVEWHRNTKENTEELETNKLALKANLELYWPASRIWMPYFFIQNEVAWDFEAGIENEMKITETNNAHSLLVTLDGGSSRWGPNRSVRDDNDNLRFLYIPTAGAEFFNNRPREIDGVNTTVDLSTALLRLYFELYPFPKHFQIVGTYSHRIRIGGTKDFGENFGHFTLGFNWYFDDKRRAGFGVNFENGRSDTNKFVDRKQVSVGFKFKL